MLYPLAKYPWGVLRYLDLPHGVRKVFRCPSSSRKLTEWSPFQASSVFFLVLCDTSTACCSGGAVRWHCQTLPSFQACKFTVLLGSPLFFLHTPILWHKVIGSLGLTFPSTPRAMYLFKSAFTFTVQWISCCVNSFLMNILLHVEFQEWPMHLWQWLVLTCV